ncbi:hypothetical protein Ocin01_18420 [Orchesella cincta]|uniref:Uncharacterized protein n=1 Tax=Orchesella cincta TaxID=48709 RepID=A0A1D2M5R8_ORCCI|nr:hypothetical protein Ocin01_18420 [Orchesella cincta]
MVQVTHLYKMKAPPTPTNVRKRRNRLSALALDARQKHNATRAPDNRKKSKKNYDKSLIGEWQNGNGA